MLEEAVESGSQDVQNKDSRVDKGDDTESDSGERDIGKVKTKRKYVDKRYHKKCPIPGCKSTRH